MPLLAFWKAEPQSVLQMSIQQVVASAGDGKLHEHSECSSEFRGFLREAPTAYLRAAAEHCLTTSFPRSGQVLQDIVNELGRRLEFEVTNGRYSGTQHAIGFDGLWRGPEHHDVIVEVKTTDAYRVSLDTIAGYRDQLRAKHSLAFSHSILIVVGRDDTGELEAQVRGSRHAWDVRLISVDALLRLLEIKESTEEATTAQKIRGLLRPAEYTRLDGLIDVLFTAAKDLEAETADSNEAVGELAQEQVAWQFTPSDVLNAKRAAIVAAVSLHIDQPLIKRTRATYWNAAHTYRAVCTLSKRYSPEQAGAYWYAYHPGWDAFLADAESGVIVLGAMDLEVCFVVPRTVVYERLGEMNTTTKPDGSVYWHLKILQLPSGELALQMAQTGNHLPLEPYSVPIMVT